jgi:hypothetical protein
MRYTQNIHIYMLAPHAIVTIAIHKDGFTYDLYLRYRGNSIAAGHFALRSHSQECGCRRTIRRGWIITRYARLWIDRCSEKLHRASLAGKRRAILARNISPITPSVSKSCCARRYSCGRSREVARRRDHGGGLPRASGVRSVGWRSIIAVSTTPPRRTPHPHSRLYGLGSKVRQQLLARDDDLSGSVQAYQVTVPASSGEPE